MQLRNAGCCVLLALSGASCSDPAPPETGAVAPAPDAVAPPPEPVAPDPGKHVFDPHFATTHGDIDAGKAFVISTKSCGPVVVSAYHLFGPSGGLESVIPVAELTSSIKEVVLNDLATHQPVLTLQGASITPHGSKPCCEGEPMTGVGDVFAFRSPTNLDSIALPVSATAMKKGDRVWVLTTIVGATDATTRFEAIVYGLDRGYLTYDFVTPGFAARATSGAPVVNAAGQVVAINLGGGALGDTQKMYGIGNPVPAWLAAVEAECK